MSDILLAIRIAFRALGKNKMRASLTVLGILIGVFSVVMVTALVSGARSAVGAQIDSIGSNVVFVAPQDVAASGARGRSVVRLTEDDARAIQRDTPTLKALSPMLSIRSQVLYGAQTQTTQIFGARIPYFTAAAWRFQRGEPSTESDELLKAKVCIIGQTVRERLFGTDDPVGRIVRIGKYPYRVGGLLASKGSALGSDQDDLVVVPITSLRARHMRSPTNNVHWIVASATSPDAADRAEEQMDTILRQRHRVQPGREPDFIIRSQRQFQEMQRDIFTVLTILLGVIAAISLLVGGIGVMNIMLVSVTERTREIGIRMAVGAREGDIRRQFLIEAVVLSAIGGISGALFGSTMVAIVAAALDWTTTSSLGWSAIAIAVSGGIGVAFGFFPAHRAAKLDPIVALRHE